MALIWEGNINLLSLLKTLEFMSSSDNLPSGHIIVVGGVIWYDSAGAEEVIVLVEENTGPGELTRTGLAMTET